MKIRLKDKKNIRNNKTGFVSLLALLLANVFLLIGMSVFAISVKELNLSFGGRESTVAFYAADGGMECALYWDIQQDAFATTTPPRKDKITCAEHNDITVTYAPDAGGITGKSTFAFIFGNNNTDSCVEVTVEKKLDGWTEIISRGRNSCDTNDSRRVERAWKVCYQ